VDEMTDMDERVRELLRRKATDVPSHGEMPQRVAGRARRRIAVNAVGIALGVAVTVVGAGAGLRLADTGANRPEGPGATAPRSSPSGPTVCAARELRVTGSVQGAMGSREGLIHLTNIAARACTLEGTPTITLLDQDGRPITSGVTFGTSAPQWQADAQPEPAGWPVVTMEPGAAAQVRLRWSNWCPDGAAAPGWQIQLPGGDSATVGGLGDIGPPPCNGQGQPSTIEVGPFEPAAGAA